MRRARIRGGRFVALLVVATVLVGTGTAFAFWTVNVVAGTGNHAFAQANTLPAGNQPSLVSQSAQDVTIGWTATTVGGNAATGYTIKRYPTSTGGSATAATNGCAGTVIATSCTESNVTPGTWFYDVTPLLNTWTGTEGSRSSVVVVPKATPTIAVTHSPTSPTLGQNVIFTATVAGPSGAATPTGTITWTLTGPVTTCGSTTGLTGTTNVAAATCTITASKAGNYSTQASVATDTTYNAAGPSTADSFTVSTATPTDTVTSSANPSTTGSAVTYTATVAGPAGGATPTGTVTFKDGGAAITNCGTNGVVTLNSGQATCAVTYSTPADPSITAAYSGDTSYSTAAGNTVNQQVLSSVAGLAFANVKVGGTAATPTCTGLVGTTYTCSTTGGNNTAVTANVTFANSSAVATVYSAGNQTIGWTATGKNAGSGTVTILGNGSTSSTTVAATKNGANAAQVTVTFTTAGGTTWTAVLKIS